MITSITTSLYIYIITIDNEQKVNQLLRVKISCNCGECKTPAVLMELFSSGTNQI